MAHNASELTRKEMKAPDAFQQTAGKAAGWVTTHQKQIVWVVVGAVGVLALALGGNAWLDSRKVAAGGALYEVLNDADGQVSSVPLPGVGAPIFPTTEAQQRAVLARVDDLRRNFGSSEAAHTAGLAAGAAQLRLGAYDAAISEYESYLSRAKTGDSLAFLALEGLAFAKEAKGDVAGAIAAFDREQKEIPARADRAALEKARLLVRSGKADEARKVLQAYPQDFKDSPLRPDAEKMLASLPAAK
jgi:tetratricopeptide (TPR) repeat protein